MTYEQWLSEHPWLVQVTGQVCGIHRSLMRAQQPSFCKGRYPMHSWQKFSGVLASR